MQRKHVHPGAHCRDLITEPDKTFMTKTCDEWLQLIKEGGDFIVGPVNTVFDVLVDPGFWRTATSGNSRFPPAATMHADPQQGSEWMIMTNRTSVHRS